MSGHAKAISCATDEVKVRSFTTRPIQKVLCLALGRRVAPTGGGFVVRIER